MLLMFCDLPCELPELVGACVEVFHPAVLKFTLQE
jgi:hypothetical protein